MTSAINDLINNYRQKIQYALAENSPAVVDEQDGDDVNYDDDELNKSVDAVDEAIINGVRSRPHLYDNTKFGYRNAAKRENSFYAIGYRLNMSGDEVMKRWKALRDRYSREIRMPNPPKKWRLFSHLSFLDNYIRSKRLPRLASTPLALNGADDDDETDKSINIEDNTEKNPVGELSECSSASLHNSGPPQKRQRRAMNNEDICKAMIGISEAIKMQSSSQAPSVETMDGETAFGIALSHRLKSLSAKQSSLAQFRIQQLLYEVEFGE